LVLFSPPLQVQFHVSHIYCLLLLLIRGPTTTKTSIEFVRVTSWACAGFAQVFLAVTFLAV
jgi:hypothetical protein